MKGEEGNCDTAPNIPSGPRAMQTEEETGYAFRLLFAWVGPLVSEGFLRRLEYEDLSPLRESSRSENLVNEFLRLGGDQPGAFMPTLVCDKSHWDLVEWIRTDAVGIGRCFDIRLVNPNRNILNDQLLNRLIKALIE